MTEAKIQSNIVKLLEENGWFVLRLVTTNKPGIPDLQAIKNKKVIFIEVKKPSKKPTALQIHRHFELKKQGISTIITTSTKDLAEKLSDLNITI